MPAVPAPAVPRAQIDVADEATARAAGLDKLAFTVQSLTGAFTAGTRARISLDYTTFRDAYGGDWAGRLQVVAFDSCWLVTPGASRCPTPRPVAGFTNDVVAGVVSFDVEFSSLAADLALESAAGGMGVRAGSTGTPGFGLSAGAYSNAGNYATSNLSSTGKWTVGLQSGSFDYSYPFDVPAAPAGPTPSAGLSYSSQAVDGLTSDQNTQGGKLGPGWSMGEAFIERRFKTCAGDGGSSGDLCWVDKNATISMSGMTGELVYERNEFDNGSWVIDLYRVSNAVGYVVKHFYRKDIPSDRGALYVDNDREHFQVISPDGVAYWFGYGSGAGGFNPGTALGSVWTVPVVGNGVGEPCKNLVDSWCHQAYRWNLDRVVDANGLSSSYTYIPEVNYYGALGRPNASLPYVSGGRLEIVSYGYPETYAGTGTETHLLDYNYAWRCAGAGGVGPSGSACPNAPTAATAASFPDLPADMLCIAGQSCAKYSPTFFDQTVLIEVATLARVGAGYERIKEWPLQYDWVDADGSGSDPTRLWLRAIWPKGRAFVAAGVSEGNIRFDAPDQGPMANRVDFNLSLGVSEMKYFRVGRVRDEYGSLTLVTYTRPRPCPVNVASDPAWDGFNMNTWSCFARWWTPTSGTAGFAAWHKWVVGSVTVHDLTGVSSTPVVTSYSYPKNVNNPGIPAGITYEDGGMAWHANTDRYMPNSVKSWDEYRGFFEVRETVGTNPADQVTTVHRFFRGMDGDKLCHSTCSPATKVATVSSSAFTEADSDWLYGLPIETFVASSAGAGASVWDVSGTMWRYTLTKRYGTAAPFADWVAPALEHRRNAGEFSLDSFSYDTLGRLSTRTEWGRVDAAYQNVTDLHGNFDERCTLYEYTQPWVWFPHGRQVRERTFAGPSCVGGALRDSATFFGAAGAVASPDPATATAQAINVDPNPTATVVEAGGGVVDVNHIGVSRLVTRYAYELNGFATTPGWGRVTSVTNPRGHATTYSYASQSGLPLSTPNVSHSLLQVVESKPLGHTTTTRFNRYGHSIRVTDANNRSVDACYDSFGRVTEIYEITAPARPALTASHYEPECVDSDASKVIRYDTFVLTAPAPAVAGDWTTRRGIYEQTRVAAGQYRHSYTILDGLLRTVQSKTISPTAGYTIVNRTTYDSAGRTVATSDPMAWATPWNGDYVNLPNASWSTDNRTSYDQYGRVTSQLVYDNDVLLRRADTSYSQYGGSWSQSTPFYSGTNPYGVKRTVTDAFGRTLSVIDDATGTPAETRYRYSRVDELIEITKPGQTTPSTMTYNTAGWRLTLDDVDAGFVETRYYPTGEVERTVDANGKIVYTDVDALGRPTATYADGVWSGNLLTSYTYDPAGNKGAVSSASSYQPQGTLAFTAQATAFDSYGRVSNTRVWNFAANSSATAGDDMLDDPIDLGASYTPEGLLQTQTYPGQATWSLPTAETVTYGYHNTLGAYGLLKSVATPTVNYVADTVYDGLGRLTTTALRAGASQPVNVNTWFRPEDGRLGSTWAVNTATNATLAAEEYTFDAAGNMKTIAREPQSNRDCFYYDTRSRLVRAVALGASGAACPASPTATTHSGGVGAFNDGYAYRPANDLSVNEDRSYTYGFDTGGLACAAGTNTTKPGAPSDVTSQLVKNSSFSYNLNDWGAISPPAGITNWARYDGAGAHSQAGYLEFNTSVANAGASVYTDVAVAPVVGREYEATVWVRSPSGVAVNGVLTLWGLWTNNENRSTAFVADGTWRPVTVRFKPQNAGNTLFRLQVYLNTTNANLDIDTVSLRADMNPNGSFAANATGWGKYDPTGGTTTLTHQVAAGTAHSDTGSIRVRTTVANTNYASVYTDVAATPVVGEEYEATVWVRSPSGTTISGNLYTFALVGGTTQSAITAFTANGTWKEVKVKIKPTSPGNTVFRVQVYLNTANQNLDIDTVGLRKVPSGPDEQLRYDCNGSLTSRVQTTGSAAVKTTYTWDANRRLVSTQQQGQSPTKFVYDASGQRVLRVDPDGTKTIYLGSTELRWSPSTPTTVKVARYYQGGTQRNFDGTITYAITGYQGSVFAGVNTASGAVSHNRYLPYGGFRTGGPINDKGFLGQTHDTGGGLVYLNNRYHDPALGTFISVDPLVSVTGEPYIYAGGNPSTLSDPTGLATCMNAGGVVTHYNATDCTGSDEEYASHFGEDLWDECRARCPQWRKQTGGPSVPVMPFDPSSLDYDSIKDVLTRTVEGWDDPTAGICGGMEGTAGAGLGWETCLVTSNSDNGQVTTVSIGKAGAKGVIKGGLVVSNAQRVSDLAGWDVCFGGGGAAGGGGGGQGCVSLDRYGVPTGIVSFSGSIEAGLGADGGPSFAYTRVLWDDNGALGFVRDFLVAPDFGGSHEPLPAPDPAGSYPGGQAPASGAPFEFWTSAG